MRQLIYKFLSENFYVKGSSIYRINSKTSYNYCLTSDSIIYELGLIFGLNKSQLKWFVKSWIHKQNKGFPFRSFWTPKSIDFGNIALPLIRRVHSQVLSQELVSVQPLTAPSGILHYIDSTFDAGYVYAPYIPLETTPIIHNGPINELVSRYATSEINPNYYGLINVCGTTVTNTTETTLSNTEKTRKETIKKWEQSGFLDGLKKSHNKNIENLYKSQMKQILK